MDEQLFQKISKNFNIDEQDSLAQIELILSTFIGLKKLPTKCNLIKALKYGVWAETNNWKDFVLDIAEVCKCQNDQVKLVDLVLRQGHYFRALCVLYKVRMNDEQLLKKIITLGEIRHEDVSYYKSKLQSFENVPKSELEAVAIAHKRCVYDYGQRHPGSLSIPDFQGHCVIVFIPVETELPKETTMIVGKFDILVKFVQSVCESL